MSPPLAKDADAPGGYRLDLDAAIENWHQVSAHDSASDCERAKAEKTLEAIRLAQVAGKKDALGDPLVEAARNALCVPVEYVYGVVEDGGECSPSPESL